MRIHKSIKMSVPEQITFLTNSDFKHMWMNFTWKYLNLSKCFTIFSIHLAEINLMGIFSLPLILIHIFLVSTFDLNFVNRKTINITRIYGIQFSHSGTCHREGWFQTLICVPAWERSYFFTYYRLFWKVVYKFY